MCIQLKNLTNNQINQIKNFMKLILRLLCQIKNMTTQKHCYVTCY